MNIHRTRRNREQGQALVFVLLTSAISLSLLASLLNRTATTSFLNDRSNRYLAAVSAAEAASEKTLASVMWDYTRSGAATVANRMNHYPTLVPALEEDTY